VVVLCARVLCLWVPAGATVPRSAVTIYTSQLSDSFRTISVDLPGSGSMFAVAFRYDRLSFLCIIQLLPSIPLRCHSNSAARALTVDVACRSLSRCERMLARVLERECRNSPVLIAAHGAGCYAAMHLANR
jgi:hypothetical protein